MSATFNRLMIIGSSVLSLLILTSGASAAPSLGMAKGRPYYGSQNQRSGFNTTRSYAPAFSTETRQSFSYEPAEGATTVTGGCGCQHHAAAPQAAQKDVTKDDVAAAPKVTRRSYSYEPTIQSAPSVRSYKRSTTPTKDKWLYPKGDPRRYNH